MMNPWCALFVGALGAIHVSGCGGGDDGGAAVDAPSAIDAAETDAAADLDASIRRDGGPDGRIDASDSGPDASTVPTVVTTTPEDQATDAEPTQAISAVFSQDMVPTTINNNTFVLRRGDALIAGQVTYDTATRTATFEPENRLALLGGYTATLTTAIVSASGEPLASGHVWSFAIRDGAWATPTPIEAHDGLANFPQIAFDPSGNAIAVWEQHAGAFDTTSSIWANRYVPGVGWGTAEPIEVAAQTASGPRIAVDPDGNAFAVWQHYDGTRHEIWANRYAIGVGWGVAERLAFGGAEPSNFGQGLDVGVDRGGNAIVIWQPFSAGGIWANRYTAGAGWGTFELINDGSRSERAHVAVDEGGNAVVVWLQDDPAADFVSSIWANDFTVGEGWGVAAPIESDSDDVDTPQLAIDRSGNAIAAWAQGDPVRSILTSRYTAGSGWGTPELIDTDSEDVQFPQLAMDTNGNAIVAWQRPSDVTVWANFYVAGAGWSAPALVDSGTVAGLTPQLAMDNVGNVIGMWLQNDDSGWSIWANRYIAGAGWAAPRFFETDDQFLLAPRLAMEPSGRAAVVWAQYDGTRYNIIANHFR